VLSAIGLALDLIGAVALTLGLYGHSRPAYIGLSRGPEDVAHDRGFAIVGAFYLALGFLLQGLQYVGVTVEASDAVTAAVAGVVLVAGVVVAWLAFGLIWLATFRRELAWVKTHTEAVLVPAHRTPSGFLGWRFWNQEWEIPPAADPPA
jgi:hypothetical protein